MIYKHHDTSFFLGAVTGVACLMIIYGYLSIVTPNTDVPPDSKSNFEVVDNYKNCELLRWSDNQTAVYKYFLHCPPVVNPSK
jgi:hypothetical protein